MMDFAVRDRRLDDLGLESYAAYLKTEHWQKLRIAFLKRDNVPEFCWSCRVSLWIVRLVYTQGFHVHHINYENLGREEFNDLVVLCGRCHELEHFNESRLPAIKIIPCRFDQCLRPMVELTPALSRLDFTILERGALQSIGEIVETWVKKPKLLWPPGQLQKIKEITSHPLCELAFQRAQVFHRMAERAKLRPAIDYESRRAVLAKQRDEILAKHPRKEKK